MCAEYLTGDIMFLSEIIDPFVAAGICTARSLFLAVNITIGIGLKHSANVNLVAI